MKQDPICPCGTGKPFSACCGPFIDGTALPETAEQLMRSRYTAYSLDRMDYLDATWHPTTRRRNLNPDEPVKWIGLKVVHTWNGGPGDAEGKVEFVARYKIGGGGAQRLHEVSRFVHRGGRWLYVDGEIRQ